MSSGVSNTWAMVYVSSQKSVGCLTLLAKANVQGEQCGSFQSRGQKQRRHNGTYSGRPADADFVPAAFLQLLKKVPRLPTAGRRLGGKLHRKLRG
jgi:hypothetical protein